MSKTIVARDTSEIILNNRKKDKAINALEFLSDLDYKFQTSLGNLFIYSAGEDR